MKSVFPKDFLWGASSSAFQIEGGWNEDKKGMTVADFNSFKKSDVQADSKVASDFYHKYKEDIKLSNEFGINGIRVSISWSRVIPKGVGEVNEKGIEYYNNLINECIANNVEPYVTLHHFDTPLQLFKNGDWLDRNNIDHFVNFAKVCFDNFGDRVTKWITFNEAWAVAQNGYIIGNFPPSIKYDIYAASSVIKKSACHL